MVIQPAARRLLERNGWNLSRRIDINAAKALLEREGYATWPDLLDFMASFNDLCLDLDLPAGRTDAVIDVEGAIAETYSSWVDEYERRIAARLAPVGSAYGGHMVLMLANNGGFYGGVDSELYFLGSDIDEMLSSLLRGTTFPEID